MSHLKEEVEKLLDTYLENTNNNKGVQAHLKLVQLAKNPDAAQHIEQYAEKFSEQYANPVKGKVGDLEQEIKNDGKQIIQRATQQVKPIPKDFISAGLINQHVFDIKKDQVSNIREQFQSITEDTSLQEKIDLYRAFISGGVAHNGPTFLGQGGGGELMIVLGQGVQGDIDATFGQANVDKNVNEQIDNLESALTSQATVQSTAQQEPSPMSPALSSISQAQQQAQDNVADTPVEMEAEARKGGPTPGG